MNSQSQTKNKNIIFVVTNSRRDADGGLSSILAVINRLPTDRLCLITNTIGKKTENALPKNMNVDVLSYDKYLHSEGLERIKYIVSSNIKAYQLVRSVRPSVVHTNDRVAFRGFGIGAWLAGTRLVDNIRDTQPLMRGERRAKWLLEFALSSRVLTLSREMCEEWINSLSFDTLPSSLQSRFESKLEYIYSIVDPERFRAPQSDSGRICPQSEVQGSPLLAYVASFHPKKKQRAFIENALPGIVERHPETVIAFVGDFVPSRNDHAHACRKAVEKLGLDGHVHFAGYRDDVERWYQAADLTVLASEKEGLARSMIESLACGTPVVSFDVASAKEILEEHDCGRVVPQGNYQQFREAITELWVDDSLRTEMGERGADAAHELFNPETVARQYQALYEEVATEG